ncbi:TPA: restriction endonuclease subunit S [Staphylococcus aureus]|nr:restriction endonuclease subunit S [Staphylococcus aureus]HDJ2940985.1 restriction endonuclease subunit S [Staphylococcus aureus]HDJ3110583.1 restriction endonuclease subunit S [Staphylococcus aureus]HDJ3115942.1 restriction endonuclease subunit S [Staphylococcus aureus]HDJ3129264.1 restriction endonuclease subunit S [Staphylococcus aureus]
MPELRFPGFEGEWEEKKLEDIIKVNSGKDYKHLDNGNIPVYGTGGYMASVSEPLSEIDAVGIGRKGTINKPYLLKAPFWTVDTLFYCTPKKEADILFILSLFRKINWKLYDESTGVPSLSKQTINKINRLVPTNKEQQKIGEFFSKLDQQIELEEQKLELLQQQKKGYMQKIFSQELRFKDENGEDYPDWEEKKLGDITEQSMYGIGASATRFDSKNIYIRITDIDEKSRKLNYQNLTTPDELNNKYKLKRNDILFARTGASTGKSYIHKEEKDIYNYYFAGFLIKFEINEQNSPLFIYQFTLTSKFNNWVKVMSVRSGQPGINSEEYAKLPLVLPNKLEQQKIAEFLDRFDQQIELEKQKIEILQQQKKGLLQSMFI